MTVFTGLKQELNVNKCGPGLLEGNKAISKDSVVVLVSAWPRQAGGDLCFAAALIM